MVEEQHVQRSWGWKVQGVLGHNNHLRWLELREPWEKRGAKIRLQRASHVVG